MSELVKIVLTSCLTVLGGILVFVIGQVVIKFLIEPIRKQAELRGEIADSLLFHVDFYVAPGSVRVITDDRRQVARTLRRQATQLMAKTHAIPWYRLWEVPGWVPKETEITKGCRNLLKLASVVEAGGDTDFERLFNTTITETVSSLRLFRIDEILKVKDDNQVEE